MLTRFHLQRHVDETGVSGTGRIAEGVVFANGQCAMQWLTRHTSIGVYPTVEDLIAIHGHDGKTELVFD